jgi:uncharacterized protein (TIGR03083 family)
MSEPYVTPPTLLPPERYTSTLIADAVRMAALGRGDLDRAVPSCPGWDVRDALRHTGSVFKNKTEWMRLGGRPESWESSPVDGMDLPDWVLEAAHEVVAEMDLRGAPTVTDTWYEPDQTVGFWYRRMALEAAVHRADVELASGEVTPVPDDLAVDGVDEVLVVFLAWGLGEDPEEVVQPIDPVAVRTGGRQWLVTTENGRVSVERSTIADGDAPLASTVEGSPSDVFLWLWGRAPDDAVQLTGKPQELRELLVRATQ